MKTATLPAKMGPVESRQRVKHPLEQLRGYIRTYVAAEGAAILLLYLALWFWIGLALDYGFFKLFAVDWVQELPFGLRAGVLIVLLAGLLTVVSILVVQRLLREFSDSALALVLERRFPKLLGDRLITAVEMADPNLAKKYGYSQGMIDQTIQEAGARVEEIPVNEVFNWKRLQNYAALVLGLTLGIYVLTGLGFCLVNGRPALGDYWHRFNDVAIIWFERNVLLENTIWPRQAHLELVGFPVSGDLRIGRNAATAGLHVRALKWVVADHHAPEGWRPMKVTEVPRYIDFKYRGLPVNALQNVADKTVDEIDLIFANDEARRALDGNTRIAIEKVLDELDTVAAEPRMSRRMRKLTIPETVMVYYKGATVRSDMTLKKEGSHEYSGTFADLKESVRFTVRGEDYYTPYQRITVVPPPSIVELTKEESRPAYLYHRLPQGGSISDIKGMKQRLPREAVSLTGDISRVDIPAGTDLVLACVADKDLTDAIHILPRERKTGRGDDKRDTSALAKKHVKLDADKRSFQVEFKNVTGRIDFDFEFTDTDHVVGRRHVLIQAVEDLGPELEVLVDVVRKVKDAYMITPTARVPFSGKVRDDHGLDRLEYLYTLNRLESQSSISGKAILVAGVAQYLSPPAAANLLTAPTFLTAVGRIITATSTIDEDKSPERVELDTFKVYLRRQEANNVVSAKLREMLRLPPPAEKRSLRDFTMELDPDRESFDLLQQFPRLKVSDERDTQPRYQLRLWLVATDNNVETGPSVGQSKEKFTFVVVSEFELLAEIAKEEEGLHVKLEDTVTRLKDTQLKLNQVAEELAAKLPEDQLRGMALRSQELEDVIVKASDMTREVHTDYSRILKELIVNRVGKKMIERVEDDICKPLEGALNQEFVRSQETLKAFRETLEAKKPDKKATELARQRLDELIDRLDKVLGAMGDLTNINKLILVVRTLEEGQNKQTEEFKKIRDRIIDEIAGGLEDTPKKKP